MYNKNQFKKVNDKKVLHKIKKHWAVISVALLGLIGGGAVTTTHVSANANADNQNNNNNQAHQQVNTNQLQNNQSKLVSNNTQSNNNVQSNVNNSNPSQNITKEANQLHSKILMGYMNQANSSESQKPNKLLLSSSNSKGMTNNSVAKPNINDQSLGVTLSSNNRTNFDQIKTGTYDGLNYRYDPSKKFVEFTNGTLNWNGNGHNAFIGVNDNAPSDINNATSVSFGHFANTSSVTNMSHMFDGASNLQSISFDYMDTSDVTDMSYMFNSDKNLSSLNLIRFTYSLDNNITNMSHMFNNDINLKSINLGYNLNTSKVTNMSYMFNGDKSLMSLKIISDGRFNTSHVTNMSNMFSNDTSLKSLNLVPTHSGVSVDFNTSHVTNMSDMFANDNSLQSLIIPDKTNFNSSTGLKPLYLKDNNSNYTTLNPVTINHKGAYVSNKNVITGNYDGLNYEFDKPDNSVVFTSGTLNWNGANNNAFIGTNDNAPSYIHNASDIKFNKGINMNDVTSLHNMFFGNMNAKSIDLSNLDTGHITDMSNMFESDTSLDSLDLDNINTSNVTNMNYMFNGTRLLDSLNLSSFDTRKASMKNFFGNLNEFNYHIPTILRIGPLTQFKNGVIEFITLNESDNDNGYNPQNNNPYNSYNSQPNTFYPSIKNKTVVLLTQSGISNTTMSMLEDKNGNNLTSKFKDNTETPGIYYLANPISVYLNNQNNQRYMLQNNIFAPSIFNMNSKNSDVSGFNYDKYIPKQISNIINSSTIFNNDFTLDKKQNYNILPGSPNYCVNINVNENYAKFIKDANSKVGNDLNNAKQYQPIKNESDISDNLITLQNDFAQTQHDVTKPANWNTVTDAGAHENDANNNLSRIIDDALNNIENDYSDINNGYGYSNSMSSIANNKIVKADPNVASGIDTDKSTISQATSTVAKDESNPTMSNVNNASYEVSQASNAVKNAYSLSNQANQYASSKASASNQSSKSASSSKKQTNSNQNKKVTYDGLTYKYDPSKKSVEFTGGTLTWNGNDHNAFIGANDNAPSDINNATTIIFDSSVDASRINNMSNMFANDNNVQSIILHSFNTINVKDMSNMFRNDTSLKNLTLSKYFSTINSYESYVKPSSIISMSNMFTNDNALQKVNIQSYLTYFNKSANLKPLYRILNDHKHTGLNNSNLINTDNNGYLQGNNIGTYLTYPNSIKGTYDGLNYVYDPTDEYLEFIDGSLTWNGNLSNDAFIGAGSHAPNELHMAQSIKFDKGIDMSHVTDMHNMFNDNHKIHSLDLSNLDTSRVTNMNGMFQNDPFLRVLNVNGWNTSNVTNMGWMFYNDKDLTKLDLSNFDTHNVTNMDDMFNIGRSESNNHPLDLNISNFNTKNVKSMNDLFSNNDNHYFPSRIIIGNNTKFLNNALHMSKWDTNYNSDLIHGYPNMNSDVNTIGHDELLYNQNGNNETNNLYNNKLGGGTYYLVKPSLILLYVEHGNKQYSTFKARGIFASSDPNYSTDVIKSQIKTALSNSNVLNKDYTIHRPFIYEMMPSSSFSSSDWINLIGLPVKENYQKDIHDANTVIKSDLNKASQFTNPNDSQNAEPYSLLASDYVQAQHMLSEPITWPIANNTNSIEDDATNNLNNIISNNRDDINDDYSYGLKLDRNNISNILNNKTAKADPNITSGLNTDRDIVQQAISAVAQDKSNPTMSNVNNASYEKSQASSADNNAYSLLTQAEQYASNKAHPKLPNIPSGSSSNVQSELNSFLDSMNSSISNSVSAMEASYSSEVANDNNEINSLNSKMSSRSTNPEASTATNDASLQSSFSNYVSGTNAEINSLTSQVNSLSNGKTTNPTNPTNNNDASEINSLNSKINSMAQNINVTTSNTNTDNNTALQSSFSNYVKNTNAEINSLNTKISGMAQNTNTPTSNNNASLQSSYNSYVNSTNAEINSLSNKINTSTPTNDASEVDSLNSKINSMKQNIPTVPNYSSLQSSYSNYVSDTNAEISSLNSKISDMSQNTNAPTNNDSAMSAYVDNTNSEISSLTNHINSMPQSNPAPANNNDSALQASYSSYVNSTNAEISSLATEMRDSATNSNYSTNPSEATSATPSSASDLNDLSVGQGVQYKNGVVTRSPMHYNLITINKDCLLHNHLSSVGKITDYAGVLKRGTTVKIIKAFNFKVNGHKYYRYEINLNGNNYYVTANPTFTINTYIMPTEVKNHRRAVISKPCFMYLHGHKHLLRHGSSVRIKRVIRHGKVTRLQLTNGAIITANKKFVKLI